MARVSKAQQEARRTAVCAGIAAGKSLQAIADELGVHPNTITSDLRAITDNFVAWQGDQQSAKLATAIANLQSVINAAWAGYDESWRIMRRWLAGSYDREYDVPDADGGTHTEKKPPVLKLEMRAYLDTVTKATVELCKLTGVAGATALTVQVQGAVTHTHEVEDLDDAFNRIADPAERAAFLERIRAADEAARLAEQAIRDLVVPDPSQPA